MNKFLKIIKLFFFISALLAFIDKLFNPRIQYLNGNYETVINYKYYLIYGVLAMSLLLLILIELKKNNFSNLTKNILSFLYILFSLYFINSFFLQINFYHLTDYILTLLLAMPTIFVIEELLKKKAFNNLYFLIIGFTIIFFDLFYFIEIYKPYEDYLFGLPIMFIHYSVRNWICLFGTSMILISIIRTIEKKQ